MARKYSEPGKRGFERPSERMFRRSRAAESRRNKSINKDARFFRIVSGVAGIGTLVVFIIIIFMSNAVYSQAAEADTAPETIPENAYTRPFIGDFSLMDLMGLAFVIVAGYAVYRKYNPPKK